MSKEKLQKSKDFFEEIVNTLTITKESLEDEFVKALDLIVNCKGNVVFTGLGKSGHVAKKAAASYSSTGNPSIFLNPVEALHGDLGIVSKNDVIIMISHSGNTEELTKLFPSITKLGIDSIGITGNPNSKLADFCTTHIDTCVRKEICPFNLAPTTSTTATLVILDVLMVMAMLEKGFEKDNFALYHPSGSLGKRLLLRVEDLIDREPTAVQKDAKFVEVVSKMSDGKKGLLPIVENDKVIGIITDGDLRRAIQEHENKIFEMQVENFMLKGPKIAQADTLAIEILRLMEQYKFTSIPIEKNGKLIGIVDIHDILKSGLK